MNSPPKNLARKFAFSCALALAAPHAAAEVVMPKSFGDHMVLQRSLPLTIWGWAEPGEKISVSFAGQKETTATGGTGSWSLTLRPLEADDHPQKLKVRGKNKIVFEDILVGDVWLVSGQSNAAFGLGGCEAPDDIAEADYPLIRFSTAWENFANKPQVDGGSPWKVMSPDTAGACSGMGFYFARMIQPEAGVPIGLLTCAVGGTDIENWMSPEAINNYPGNADVAKSVKERIDLWEKELPSSKASLGERPAYYPVDQPIGLDLTAAWLGKVRSALKTPDTKLDPAFLEFETWVVEARAAVKANKPVPIEPELKSLGHWLLSTSLPDEIKRIPILPYPIDRQGVAGHGWFRTQSLYNGMIHPFIPIRMRGMLWYQGEGANNVPYFERMRAMIETMREEKGRDFPVYIVQLPNWGEATNIPAPDALQKWPGIREEMLKCLQIPKTGLAVTIDIGDAENLHPLNKKDVGERLARWALAKDYGKNIVYSGPIFQKATVAGDKIRLSFEHLGSGLMVGKKVGVQPVVEDADGKLQQFAIAGSDKKWVVAEAKIVGKEIVVSSSEVPDPVAVRYAFTQNPEGAKLYNKEGLPASPFRTDAW